MIILISILSVAWVSLVKAAGGPRIPPNLVKITPTNYEEVLRDTDETWLLALVQPNYDISLLRMLSELDEEFSGVHFAYTNVDTPEGEMIKASFEAGMVPQIFCIITR